MPVRDTSLCNIGVCDNFCVCVIHLWAVQISSAQLNGTVHDESGGAVAKASVSLREMETNRTYTTTTNDSGFYVLPNLGAGTLRAGRYCLPDFRITRRRAWLTGGQSARRWT